MNAHVWRDQHPIKSFADIFKNIVIEYGWLCDGLKGFFARCSVKIVFATMIAYLAYLIKKNDTTNGGRSAIFTRILLLVAVIVSFYIQQIPVGVPVKVRTIYYK